MSPSVFLVSLTCLSCLMGSGLCWPVISPGPCPAYTPVASFNVSQYMGVWYQVQGFPAWFEYDTKCITATYVLEHNQQGPYVRLNNTGVRISDGKPNSASGTATQPYPPEAALIVHFDGAPLPPDPEPNYNLLAVNTSSYALVYTCKSLLNLLHVEFVMILAREPYLSDDVISYLKQVLEEDGSDPSHLTVTNQTGCGY